MGHPRKIRRKYKGPRHPYNVERFEEELKLVGEYGLRNKKEIWQIQTRIRRYRQRARATLALIEADRAAQEVILLNKLRNMGVIPEDASIDSVLGLKTESFMERRLQTKVFRLGLAASIHQARQLVVHGHISVGGRRVNIPSFHLKRGEDEVVTYFSSSPFNSVDHPIRQFHKLQLSESREGEEQVTEQVTEE